MSARLSRLAGAMLLRCEGGEYFLVGNTKEPCKFPEQGFERPASLDGDPVPFVRLKVTGDVKEQKQPLVVLPQLGDAESLAKRVADRLLIVRNQSVSDRLWRLITNPEQLEPPPSSPEIDGAWLVTMPAQIWGIVRDTVLRCV